MRHQTANIWRDGATFVFRVNGRAPRVAWLSLAATLVIAGLVLAAMAAILSTAGEEGVLYVLLAGTAGIAGLVVLLRLVLRGWFAPYEVRVDPLDREIRTVLRSTGAVLWEGPLDADRLHVTGTHVRVGYVSSLRHALVHGELPNGPVEDVFPTPALAVLTVGRKADILALRDTLVRQRGSK